jgi:hypothetical protein
MAITTKKKLNSKTLVKQRSIRLNIDKKLDFMLQYLAKEFPLLDQIEILKFLISKGFQKYTSNSFSEFLETLDTKYPNRPILSEEAELRQIQEIESSFRS